MNHSRMLKRVFDFCFALVTILLLSPLLLFIFIYVWCHSSEGEPVIFQQKRPGLNTRLFSIYKFRTMTSERDSKGNILSHDQRLKPWGKMLRRFDLDELPQLFNILKGDMSLIGPRPQLVSDLLKMTVSQLSRQNVLPGITCLYLLHENKVRTWEEKFDFDVLYVKNWSLLLDVHIFLKTISILARRERPDERNRIS